MTHLRDDLMTILLKALIVLLASAATFPTAAGEAPYLYVLGVAQDAGFPQAGCYKSH